MIQKLNKEFRSILLELAKRNNKEHLIWFNCSLNPIIGDEWTCHICQANFVFIQSILEIEQHGIQHIENSKLKALI